MLLPSQTFWHKESELLKGPTILPDSSRILNLRVFEMLAEKSDLPSSLEDLAPSDGIRKEFATSMASCSFSHSLTCKLGETWPQCERISRASALLEETDLL